MLVTVIAAILAFGIPALLGCFIARGIEKNYGLSQTSNENT